MPSVQIVVSTCMPTHMAIHRQRHLLYQAREKAELGMRMQVPILILMNMIIHLPAHTSVLMSASISSPMPLLISPHMSPHMPMHMTGHQLHMHVCAHVCLWATHRSARGPRAGKAQQAYTHFCRSDHTPHKMPADQDDAYHLPETLLAACCPHCTSTWDDCG